MLSFACSGAAHLILSRSCSERRELGIEKHVQYLGARQLEDLVPEIDVCDVGVIPNQRNAFTDINTPTRIFEYLASGKPVDRADGRLEFLIISMPSHCSSSKRATLPNWRKNRGRSFGF